MNLIPGKLYNLYDRNYKLIHGSFLKRDHRPFLFLKKEEWIEPLYTLYSRSPPSGNTNRAYYHFLLIDKVIKYNIADEDNITFRLVENGIEYTV